MEASSPLGPVHVKPRRDLCIIHNPTAGRRRTRFYDAVAAALEERGCRLTVRETSGPESATELARAAAAEPFEAVVAAGGDGTINEVVNGLAGAPMPLGLIPLGTANVLAAEIGLPRRPESVAAALIEGALRSAYIGRANGRAFAMMAEVGFNAHVVHGIDLGLKRWVGRAA